jgi:DNA-binding beta-propeller fold protein YncE
MTRTTRGTVALGGSPRGVTISPDSRLAYVTLGPQNKVITVNLTTLQLQQSYNVGTAPDGVAFSDQP